MEEMTRLFGLDFQLLHDVVLMALAVFFLFLFMSKMLFEPARKLLNERTVSQPILRLQKRTNRTQQHSKQNMMRS